MLNGGRALPKTTALPRVAAVPTPGSKNQQRKARKVANAFTRKPVEEDVLTSRLQNLNLADPSPVFGFDDMGLDPNLLKGIYGHGLERPAVCQQTVILPMIQGRDIICQAQSGMGKTAAFCISVLQRLELSGRKDKALVLAPTRELAEQILAEFQTFAQFMPGVKIISCIGGDSKFKINLKQVESANFHVAVGTLGRIAHLLREEPGLDGDSIKMFVIDEADKMVMDSSFKTDLNLIIGKISADAQVIVASATMPRPAFDHVNEFMRHPFTFLLRNDQLTLDGIQQFHVQVGSELGKLDTMNELFPIVQKARGIIFCNTRGRAEYLSKMMEIRGHTIENMTGTMEQDVRRNKLADFKVGRLQALIASDLLGRGVDIHHVQLVINYDLPQAKEDYIHRIGRAGRYGKKGVGITFLTESQFGRLQELEDFYETKIPQLPVKIQDIMNKLN